MPLTPDQLALSNNSNVPAGQAGSPWTPAPTPPAVYGRGGTTPTPTTPATPAGGFPAVGSGANVPATPAVPGLNQTESGQYTGAENTLGTPNTIGNEISNEQQLLNARRDMASGEIANIMAGENAQVTAAQKNAEYGAAASGMMGTPGAGAAISEAVQPTVDQAQADLSKILLGIDQQAESDANLIQQQNQAQATGDINTLNNIATQRATAQTNAQNLFTAASKTPNVDFNSFINSPYGQQLLQSSGYDSTSAALVWNSNQAIADQIQWQAPITDNQGNSVIYGINPKTGQVETQTIGGGAPTGSSTVISNGLPFFQQNNPDGTPNPKGLLMPAPLTASEKTAAIQQYQFYVAQTENAGGTPVDEFTYAAALKAVVANTNANGVTPTSPTPTVSTDPSVGGSAFANVVSDPTSSASKNNLIGLEGTDGKFISYPDLQSGINGGIASVTDRISKLTAANPNATIMDLSNSWKGTGNNDATAWANSVASAMGVSANTKLSTLDPTETFYAMAKHESQYDPTASFNVADESRPPVGPAGNVPMSSIGGKTPNSLWQDSIKYATQGGNVQQFTGGLSSKPAQQAYKNAVQDKSAALITAAGVDAPTLQQEWTANSGAINTQVTYMNSVQRALDGADQTGSQIMSAFSASGISPTDSKWANTTLNDIAANITGGQIQAYKAGIAELGNEYSQVFSRGGQNTVQSHYNAQDVVNGNIKLSDLQGVLDELQAAGKIVIGTSLDQIKSIAGGGGTDAVAQFLSYIHGVPIGTDNSGGSNNQNSNDPLGIN